MAEEGDNKDESSVCTSSSSSWATSDDERRYALTVRRKKKRVEAMQSQLPETVITAESLTPNKDNGTTIQNTESPRKSPTKRKKKRVSQKDGKGNETVKAVSPTKQKMATEKKAIAKSPRKKSPVKKSLVKKKVVPSTKEVPTEVSPVVQSSPAKRKKKAKEPNSLHDTKTKAAPAADNPKKSPRKKKKEKPSSSKFVTAANEPKKKNEKSVKEIPSSIPNRPHTAPTQSKKKVILSSDDDDNSAFDVVRMKPLPLASPSPTKPKFSFSSDDSSCSSDDSSDSEHHPTKRAVQSKENSKKIPQGNNGDESESSTDSATAEPKPQIDADGEFTRSVPPRALSGESTDSSGPPIPLGLRPGQKQRSMSLGSTDSEPPISLSMRPGNVSRTFSAESTDSDPPISLSLRPGKIQRSMSDGTIDSEPPFPLDLRPGRGVLRTYSGSSTDSEPPFSLSIRPGASMRNEPRISTSSDAPFPMGLRSRASMKDQVDFNQEKGIDYEAERMNLRSPPRTSSIESTDSEPPISLGLRPGAPNLTISGLDLAQGQFLGGEGSYELHEATFGRPRRSRPFVPCPSYVPPTEDQTDVESMYRSAIAKKAESNLVDKPRDSTDPSNLLSSTSLGLSQSSCSKNNSIGNLVSVDRNTMAMPKEETHYDPLSEVSLRHVPMVAKPQKKNRRRRESFLFRDLQRFAKKTANELRSDDEGISDDGSENFCGEQSLNLMEAMEDSTNPDDAAADADFYKSAPISAIQNSVSGKSGVIEPITPKFEEIRKTFLRMSAMNELDEGKSQKRRHSTLVSRASGHTNEKPIRRHSTFTKQVIGVNDNSSCNGVACRSPPLGCISPQRTEQRSVESKSTTQQIPNSTAAEQTQPVAEIVSKGKTEQRRLPDRAPSASLTNVVSLQDRIKLLSLSDGGTDSKQSNEARSNLYGSPQKNRLSRIAEPSKNKSTQNAVSSSMDALLSPRKEFSSKKSIHHPRVQYNATDSRKGDTNHGKLSFHKSVGTIPVVGSDEMGSQTKKSPTKSHDHNNDSLEDLRATVEALHKEIGQAEQVTKSTSPKDEEDAPGSSSSNGDNFEECVGTGTGLSNFFSTVEASDKKAEEDEKSMESALTYDVQDVLTSFSQQRKLAMERARAARPKGGKLEDRMKFLQSS